MPSGMHESGAAGFRSLLEARPVPGHSEARCLIVGEVAQSHDGSLGMAHAFIDAIAAAGADAVKFQTHIAHAESTAAEPWRVRFSVQDESRYAYWRRMASTCSDSSERGTAARSVFPIIRGRCTPASRLRRLVRR